MRYSIKEIEKLTGIKAHTIRMWEKRYGLIVPSRTDTNIRYYNEDQLKEFLNVSLLLSKGYKISAVSKLGKEEILTKTKGLSEHNLGQMSSDECVEEINKLIVSMLDLDKFKFEKVFNTSLLRRGFKETLLNVVCPFMDKLDLLWQTTDLTTAHQNFILSLLRQKTIVALDAIDDNKLNGKKYLFFLPKYEYADNCLLMAKFIIKEKGCQTLFVGSNMNALSLKRIIKQYDPAVLVSYSHNPKAVNQLISIFSENLGLLRNKNMIVCGDKNLNSPLNKFGNVMLFKNIREIEASFGKNTRQNVAV